MLTCGINAEEVEIVFETFLWHHDLKKIAQNGTCFKNTKRRNRINLFLIKIPLSFQNTTSVFTGLSDFHTMMLTVFKTAFTESIPKKN